MWWLARVPHDPLPSSNLRGPALALRVVAMAFRRFALFSWCLSCLCTGEVRESPGISNETLADYLKTRAELLGLAYAVNMIQDAVAQSLTVGHDQFLSERLRFHCFLICWGWFHGRTTLAHIEILFNALRVRKVLKAWGCSSRWIWHEAHFGREVYAFKSFKGECTFMLHVCKFCPYHNCLAMLLFSAWIHFGRMKSASIVGFVQRCRVWSLSTRAMAATDAGHYGTFLSTWHGTDLWRNAGERETERRWFFIDMQRIAKVPVPDWCNQVQCEVSIA